MTVSTNTEAISASEQDTNTPVDGVSLAAVACRCGVDFIQTGARVEDVAALVETIEDIGKADAAWLAAHPGCVGYRRLASESERRAYGLPPHACAVVSWSSDGCVLTEYFGIPEVDGRMKA